MKLRSLGILLLLTGAVLTGCQAATSVGVETTDMAAEVSIEEETQEETQEIQEEVVSYPITIQHAFGETTIEKKPERIATISWGNQDVPLALGVVPVGVSRANYGEIGESGLLPWTEKAYEELGVESPILFDDTDSLDFEAISDANPDIILASYSGITQEDYDLLSQIAPVVAYPTMAWQTYWRDQILLNSTGMGMLEEGEALVESLEQLIKTKAEQYPQLAGKSAAFCYFSPTDLGNFYVYLPTDPRAAYLTDLGLEFPESVLEMAESSDSFALELSSENVDILKDVDLLVVYGDQTLLDAMQDDALLGTLPAIQKGAVALIPDGSNLAASCTPSALSIPATIDEYLALIGEVALPE